MPTVGLVRVLEDRAHPWWREVNPIVDILSGNGSGLVRLVGNATYPLVVQSTATGGPHAAVLHSTTTSPKTVTPTAANSVLLVRDDYVAIGMAKELRVYDSVGTDYGVVKATETGQLVLQGRDVSGHTIFRDDGGVDIAQVNEFGVYTLATGTFIGTQLASTPGTPTAQLTRLYPRTADGRWRSLLPSGLESVIFDAGQFTAGGQIPYASAANTIAVLPIGAAGTMLVSDGSVPSWSATPTLTGPLILSSSLFIGDNANTNMTLGLTINQGSASNEAFALKQSNVAHGITNAAETDTYYHIVPISSTDGGAFVRGLADTGNTGIRIQGVAPTNDTTKSTAGRAGIELRANKGVAPNGVANDANANLLVVQDAGSTRFIVDAEGDIHADSGSATANTGTGYLVYDEFDDAQLVRALDVQRGGPGLRATEFDRLLRYGRADLEAAGLAEFNDHKGGDGSIFVNYSAVTRLLCGTAWQQYTAHHALVAEVATLRSQIKALTSGTVM